MMNLETIFSGLLLLVASLLVRAFILKLREQQKERRLGCKPPNKFPHRLPFGLDLHRARNEAIKAGRYNWLYKDHFEQYGTTFDEYTFGVRTINTAEPENFQTVAATKFDDYGKVASRTKIIVPILGDGIFSKEGAEWRHSRNLIKPLFKRAELNDLESFKKFVDRVIDQIPRDGTTVDLQPLFSKLFVDSSTEFIFGESIDSLIDTTGKAQEFLDAFTLALIGAGKRGNQAMGKFSFLFASDEKEWLENCRKIRAFADRHVARALAATDANKKEKPPNQPQRYVLIDEMAKEIRDPVALRSELMNVFLPARDGTSIALANTFFFLARHPTIWTELRSQSLALGDTPLTFEVLKSLPLFRYTVFEALRLESPQSRTLRQAVRDTVLPVGGGPDGSAPVYVPKDTIVALNSFPIHYDPKHWGDDAEQFRPSRHEGATHTWDFVPFLGGARICPAQQQTITQAVYMLLRFTREFESIENRDPCFEYKERIKALCESWNGVQVALHPAKAS